MSDQNKSKNGKIPNTVGTSDAFADLISGSPGVSKTLEQIRAEQRLATSSGYIQEQFQKVARGEMPLAQANELASRVSPYVNKLERDINQMEVVRGLKGEREYGRTISSAVNASASASRISAYTQDPNIIGEGVRRGGPLSYDDVYGQRNEFKQRADVLRSRMMEEASSNSPNRQDLGKLGGQLSYAERGVATSNVAMRDLARRGLDPTGQYRSIEDTISTITGRERGEAAKQAVAGGIDWKSFQAELKSTAESLKQLNKEFQEGTKTEKEYREEAAKLSVSYSKGLDIEAAGKASGVNTSGKGFIQNIKDSMSGIAWVGVAGEAIKQTSRVLNYANVQSEEQRMDLATGFAGMANRQFEDQQAGLGGNMAAFRRAFGGAFGRAGALGANRGAWNQYTRIGEATGNAIIAGGDVASNATMGDTGGAIRGGIIGAADASMQAIATAKGLDRGSASLRANQQSIALEDANAHVSDATRQRAFDTVTGINRATRGLGGRRQGVVNDIASSKMVSEMAGAMITQEQMQSLTAQGVGQLGTAFSGATLSGAARAQKSGVMTAQDYISNLGQMTNTGGSAKDLENIMKTAVAAGMDNSKNIAQMVAATAALAAGSAGAGVNASSGAQALIAKGVQGLSNLPENMRVGAAQNAAAFAEGAATDKGLSLYTVANFASLRGSFKGATRSQLDALNQMTPAMTEALRKGDMEVANNIGLGEFVKEHGGARAVGTELQRIQRQGVINRITSFGGTAASKEDLQALQEFGKTGNEEQLKRLHPQAYAYFQQQAFAKEHVSGDALLGLNSASEARTGKLKAGGTTTVDAADAAATKAAAAVFKKGLDSFGGKFEEFAKTMESLSENWPINEEAAKKMSESFSSFDMSTDKFGKAVDKLTVFLDRKTGGWNNQSAQTQKAGTGQANLGK